MEKTYTDLLAELEAIRARRHDRDYQDWLERVAAIVRDAGLELGEDIDRYDARQARRCQACADHYGDDGRCDEGKPVASPHRRQITDAELDRDSRARDMAEECRTWERGE